MQKLWALSVIAIVNFATIFSTSTAVLAKAADDSQAQLRVDRLKTLYRREPRAQQIVPALEKSLSQAMQNEFIAARKNFLEQTIMYSGSLSADRLSDYLDLLQTLNGPVIELATGDLAPLQEQYRKVTSALDDLIFTKDLDSALHLHDRFIQNTSLGVWDKDRTSKELQRIEQAIGKALDIPYGRTELLRNLAGKRLLPSSKGCYIGIASQEEIFISTDRLSSAIIEEATSTPVQLDAATMVVAGPDGKLYDLNDANNPAYHLPFAPPLSLWMKSRLLEGHIPAITFQLTESSSNKASTLGVQDILDGKLDDYFSRNLKLIAGSKAPTMVGLFENFDTTACANAFGADGRTPYYFLVDPKLAKLPADKLQDELKRLLSRGALARDVGAELRKYYGDPAIPDGPERIAAAWKHFRKLITECGGNNISLYSAAAPFHGNKKALGFAGQADAGAQEWNKLEYYWPGDGILDWSGATISGADLSPQATADGPVGSIDSFMHETASSNWQSTPVLMRSLGPGSTLDPNAESAWLHTVFAELLPRSYTGIRAIFIDFPGQIRLQSPDALSTFRSSVSSNPYYKQQLRLEASTLP